jgi:hypothetical protein
MNDLPNSTPKFWKGPSPFPERRKSSISLYERGRITPTSEKPFQPRCSITDPSSGLSYPAEAKKSRATSIVESDFSQRHSGYSTKSISADLLHDAVVPSANHHPNVIPEPCQPSMSSLHKAAFIAVACLAQFLSLAGMNQTVAPVMVLAKYFNINDYGTLSWFSAAYSMSLGTFILPAGELSASAESM